MGSAWGKLDYVGRVKCVKMNISFYTFIPLDFFEYSDG